MAELRLDMRDFGKLVRDIKRAEPVVAAGFTKSVKDAAAIVAKDAKSIASQASSRIPGSIRVVGGGRRVAVRAGGARAPHAAAFEHDGEPGTFRHPVFGNYDVWEPQAAHPYLHPAEQHTHDAYMAAVTLAVDHALRQVGL